MKLYYEMREKETEDNIYRPREIFRQYVDNELEAEDLHKEKMKDSEKYEDFLVEMNHDPEGLNNKPCIKKYFDSEGKVKT